MGDIVIPLILGRESCNALIGGELALVSDAVANLEPKRKQVRRPQTTRMLRRLNQHIATLRVRSCRIISNALADFAVEMGVVGKQRPGVGDLTRSSQRD